MKRTKTLYALLISVLLLQSCAVIRPGEVGVDTHFGKIQNKILEPGPHHFFGVFGRDIVRFDTRVVNYSKSMKFHSNEGIEVTAEITILYHINPDSVKSIYNKYGLKYQTIVIEDNLLNTIRHVGLDYKTIELITARSSVEDSIKTHMTRTVGQNGFIIDLVMLKEVDLPENIIATIQSRLNAEENAKKTKIDNEIKRELLSFELEKQKKEAVLEIEKQRLTLDFTIEKQNIEAQRLLIEAESIKKQQQIINATLTENLLKLKSLEITKELVNSTNTKIIITDGKSPVILKDIGEK